MRRNHRWLALVLLLAPAWVTAQGQVTPEGPAVPSSATPYSLVRTSDGEPADATFFLANETCATCHERQQQEFQGSMHSASHLDPLYRRFAVLSGQEAGDGMYTFCAGCHAPAGVVSGLIPETPEEDLPDEIRAGVTCDVCHQISSLTGHGGPWKTEANASFTLQPGRVKFGASGDVVENRLHRGEKKEFYGRSEYCASCHTVIHPVNGLVIEGTYDEWKKSVYAEKGIQCQDCHMRSVDDALIVARTLQPVVRRGPAANMGRERPIHAHHFVGGNVDAERLAQGPNHARMAEQRLQTAARLEVIAPADYAAGQELKFEILVHNEAAGHDLPTGVTELRQMWVEVRIVDDAGGTRFAVGQLDEHGELPANAIWFGALGADAAGKPTFKPWALKSFLRHRGVPPKGTARDMLTARMPADVSGPLTIEARLRYRSVAPHVVAAVLGDDAYQPTITEMAKAVRMVGQAQP